MKNTKKINSETIHQAKKNKFEIEVDDGENVFKVEVEVSDDEEFPDIKPSITEKIEEIDSCTPNNSIDQTVRNSMCHICGKNIDEDQLRTHLKDHYLQKQQCHLCDLEFENILKYKRHVLEDHKQKKLFIYRCEKCDIIFQLGSHYRIHHENLHGIKSFPMRSLKKKKTSEKEAVESVEVKCRVCGFMMDKSNIYHHMLNHNVASQTCQICGVLYKNVKLHMRMAHEKSDCLKAYLIAEESTAKVPRIESLFANVPEVNSLIIEGPEIDPAIADELDNKPITIEETEMKFPPDEEISEEKITSTDVDCVECGYCGQKVNRNLMLKHVQEHLKKYHCKLCNLDFKYENEYKFHVLETHEEEKRLERYCCKKCNISFQLASLFKSHVEEMHKDDEDPSPEEKIDELKDSYMREKCKVCGVLIRKAILEVHILNHEKPKHFCEVCGKFIVNIKSHIANVHNNPKYTCKKCGRKYTRRIRYQLHLKSHLGIRNHVCKTCGKCFLTPHSLNRHNLGTHLKLRSFICEICNKAFSSGFAMRTHKRQHTNETPFRCEECGDGFKHNVSLKAHRKSKHNISDPKTCPCPVCGKKFPSKLAISTHMRVH